MSAMACASPIPSSPAVKVGPIDLSVCMPAYNEHTLIVQAIEEVLDVLDHIPGHHELLVLDDGSTDGTLGILLPIALGEPRLRILRHRHNLGNPAAQRTLIAAARGRYIVHVGADCEWRMTDIPRLFARLQRGVDVVIGIRTHKDYTLGRQLVSTVYNRMVTLLWGIDFQDIGSMKIARAALWQAIPTHSNSAFIHAERLLVAIQRGAQMATIPVAHRRRRAGRSRFTGLRPLVRALVDLLRFWLTAPRPNSPMTLGDRQGGTL